MRECATLSNGGLEKIAMLTGLRHLDLRGCENIMDSGLKALGSSGLNQLTRLDLGELILVSDVGVSFFHSNANEITQRKVRGFSSTNDTLGTVCVLSKPLVSTSLSTAYPCVSNRCPICGIPTKVHLGSPACWVLCRYARRRVASRS